jgi:pimeloyl-ACP methyl ester carboxylesterase
MRRVARGVAFVLLVFLFLLAAGPFLIPVPPLEGTVPPETLADPDSRFAEIGGLTVHYKTAGAGGPAIILLHGFGASVYSWHAVMEPLGRSGSVLAYDRPAFGLTERPMEWKGRNPYGPDANIDLLMQLMDHFGYRKAVLIGNSAGGTLAMNFALAHPDRVLALILVDPAVYAGGPPAWLSPFLALPQVRHLGPLIARQIKTRGPELLRTAWHDPSKITPETEAAYEEPLRVNHWDLALWYLTTAGSDTGIARRLDELVLPVLVITGDDDRIVPTEQSVRLAGELPSAELAVIPDAGHVPHEEQPQAFLDAVGGFLQSAFPELFANGLPCFFSGDELLALHP